MPTFRTVVRMENPVLGGIGTNTWHGRVVSVSDVGIAADLSTLTDIMSQFYTDLLAIYPSGTVLSHDGNWVQVLTEDPEIRTGYDWTLNGAGAAEALPPQTSIVVGWRSQNATRGGRGRTFLGPLENATCDDDGTPKAATLTAVRAAATDLVESSDSMANGAFGVYSQGLQLDPPGPIFRDFVSTATRDIFGSLRSRRD